MKLSSTFAIIGSGAIGAFVIDQVLACKATGLVTTLKIVSRSLNPYYPTAQRYPLSYHSRPTDEIFPPHLARNHQVYLA